MKQIRAALTAIALAALAGTSHAAWQHAHADSANTGFELIDTAPAQWTAVQQPLGSVAPGANPVIGPNGDLYIGNLEGEVRAYHADGTPFWTRKLDSYGGIFASPVVGADGSIYVVSTIHYVDHRGGINDRNDSFLHKFSPGGAWIFHTPFPEQFSASPTIANRGATTAPPNIWRWNGSEALIVPVVYRSPVARDVRLVAFSSSGTVLADALVTQGSSPQTTGGGSQWLSDCISFWRWTGVMIFGCVIGDLIQGGDDLFTRTEVPVPLAGAGFPLPGVAIRPDTQGGPPVIMLSDGRQDKVAYAFSPDTGFSELNRSRHLLRRFITPPVVLGNGDTVTGTLDGYLTRTAANFAQLGVFRGLGTLTAAPTRLSDGALVIVDRSGSMTVVRGHVSHIQLAGESIASAAASCNHFFVATTNDFETFDAKTLGQVASMPWTGGGLHSPVIGPSGHVYAIASDTLHVFAPPWRPPYWNKLDPSCLLPPILSQ
jgi:hypothetical protein